MQYIYGARSLQVKHMNEDVAIHLLKCSTPSPFCYFCFTMSYSLFCPSGVDTMQRLFYISLNCKHQLWFLIIPVCLFLFSIRCNSCVSNMCASVTSCFETAGVSRRLVMDPNRSQSVIYIFCHCSIKITVKWVCWIIFPIMNRDVKCVCRVFFCKYHISPEACSKIMGFVCSILQNRRN